MDGTEPSRHSTQLLTVRTFGFQKRYWPALTCCCRTRRLTSSNLRFVSNSVLSLPSSHVGDPHLNPCCFVPIVPVLFWFIPCGGWTNSGTRATSLDASRTSSSLRRHRRYPWTIFIMVPNYVPLVRVFFSHFRPGCN